MVDNESYLIADYRIKCFDGDYFTFLGFVIPIVLFLTIGLPFGIALYLWRHRKELNSPDIVVQVGFIYSAYKQGSEFWEMHEILRKILLTSAILFYQSEPSLQAGIAIGICFMGECMLNYFQPQKNRNLFWLAQISFFFTGPQASISYKFLPPVAKTFAKDRRPRFLITRSIKFPKVSSVSPGNLFRSTK